MGIAIIPILNINTLLSHLPKIMQLEGGRTQFTHRQSSHRAQGLPHYVLRPPRASVICQVLEWVLEIERGVGQSHCCTCGVRSIERNRQRNKNNYSVILKVSLREEKNDLGRKVTAACCREKSLALPGGGDIRKVFRQEGVFRLHPESQRSSPAREEGFSLLGTQPSSGWG